MVLALAVSPERRRDDLAVLVEHVGFGLLALEVGRRRVEEQQVDLEVQQIGGLKVHLLGELVLDLQQPVHRPVAGVLVKFGEPVDPRPLAHPPARRQLAQRLKRAVGDHREDHPFRARVEAAARKQPRQRPVDAEDPPQAVKRPRPADRPRLHEAQLPARRRSQRLIGLEHPLKRADQPHDRGAVQPVLTPEAVQHPHDRVPGLGVPLVVRELQIADLAAVRALACRAPQIHDYLEPYAPPQTEQGQHPQSVYLGQIDSSDLP